MRSWAQDHVIWTASRFTSTEFYHVTSTILELFRKHGKPEHRKLALLVIQLACPSNDGTPFRFKSREDTKPVVNIFNAVAAPVEKDKGHVTVIDDLQAALTQSLRPDDAPPRLQQRCWLLRVTPST